MNESDRYLDFVDWFEGVVGSRPGMLGSIAEISAMFYVVDNVRSLALSGERLPAQLSWNAFLIEKKLIKESKSVPAEEAWDLQRFADLRRQYLKWVESRRVDGNADR